MLTIYETPMFKHDADRLWSAAERNEFFVWLAQNPEAGKVVEHSGGCRKVRWGVQVRGKSAGVRVIYVQYLELGELWALLVYPKSEEGNIPGHILKKILQEVENGRKASTGKTH